MNTVNLVATTDAIQRHFPHLSLDPLSSRILSADFPLTPSACTTKLGAWLATRILTTRFDDDAATCRLLLPVTELGLHFRDFGAAIARETAVRDDKHAELLFRSMESWITKHRNIIKQYGKAGYAYRTIQYHWPVFGSAAASKVQTPEAYFDFCATQIRATGGVILRAGLTNEPLPESIARTMAPKAGGGLLLLERYRMHSA